METLFVRCTICCYPDYVSLKHIFDQRDLNMGHRREMEILYGFECEILYLGGKASDVANALSREGR